MGGGKLARVWCGVTFAGLGYGSLHEKLGQIHAGSRNENQFLTRWRRARASQGHVRATTGQVAIFAQLEFAS